MTTCPSCGADAPDGSRFCPACGTALVEAAAAEETLKLVTVLFADVVGSTARAERMHPEDTRALMADYFAAMSEEIAAEGGAVEKFVGDAIMAVFGVPAAHEDDAVRAVRAGRRMLDRLRAQNEEREPGEQLEIRIGMNTGDVVASGAAQRDLLVTGDAVNVAARLQQTAEPGEIVIGERTARAVRPYFELLSIDVPDLKGKSEDVVAWAVGDELEAPEPRGVPGLRAPMVGRSHELDILRAMWDAVCGERRPRLVTIVGDAGVGKSRLVSEFVSQVEVAAKTLVGRCLPYGEGVTLWPLVEILKAEAVVLDTDPPPVVVAKIAQLVSGAIDAELLGDGSRTTAALLSTIGVEMPDDPLRALDPRALYRERINAWRALLGSLARETPVVAVIDDIHWADATMLDVLDELAELVDGPVLFLCPARPDLLRSRPDWGGGRRSFSSLPLDPLSSEESAKLVSSLLDIDGLSDNVRGRILQRSEGNPFFLEEIVRHLIDDGLLVHEHGRWEARAEIDNIEIPDNVQAVILARLDLLSREERRVAQRAAVVGRVFWDGAVAKLAGDDDLDAILRTLRRRELVLDRLSSSIAGQAEYIFKHVLIRDVAYESLPRKERSRAHVETAAWIEQTTGERAGEFAELLAHHYDAAAALTPDDQLRAKAREYLLAAAQNALRRFAIEQAERLALKAVELSKRGDERVDALEALGDLHYITFNGDRAWRAFCEALDELPVRDSRYARLAGKACLFGARWVGAIHEQPEVDEVERLVDAGLEALGPADESERVLLLVDKGFLLTGRQRRKDEAAVAAVRAAKDAAEELDDPDLLSAALDLAQGWEASQGRWGAAREISSRRNTIIPRMTDTKEIGDSYAMGAMSAQHTGLYAEAEERATVCIESSRGIDSGSYLHGLTWRVAARFMLGKWEEALADQAELEDLAAMDPRELPAGFTMRAYTYRALCHELRGERDEADRYIDVGRRYFEFVTLRLPDGMRGWRTSVHSPPLARALAYQERYEEAIAFCPHTPRSEGAGFALETLCEIAGLREDWEGAHDLVAVARAEAEQGMVLSLPLFADRLEGRAAASRGDVQHAATLLRHSAEGFAALGARWEEAWSRLLLGELLGAEEPPSAERELAAALPVFEALGSVRELERARAILSRAAPID
jgi:class 3 adenylate cyclase